MQLNSPESDRSVQERLTDLEQTVKRQQEEIEQLREENETLRDVVEIRTPESRPPAVEDIFIKGLPLGPKVNSNYGKVEDLVDRVVALEAGEVETENLAPADSDAVLSIQRKLQERQNGIDVTPKNLWRATFVWQEFHSRAVSDSGFLKLESPQVKNILDGEDLDTNPNTVRRVMRQLAKHTGDAGDPKAEGNLITFESGADKNVLVANRDEWNEWGESLERDVERREAAQDTSDDPTGGAEAEADAAFDALLQGEQVTDPESDPLEVDSD